MNLLRVQGVQLYRYRVRVNEVCVVTCADIDECDMFNNLCVNGQCENVMGYFQCSCAPGYKLDSTAGNCTGTLISVCLSVCLTLTVYTQTDRQTDRQ